MKKAIKRVFVIWISMLMMTGCGSKQAEQTKETAQKPELKPIVIGETKEEEQEPEEPVDKPISPMDVNSLGTAGTDVVAVGIDEEKIQELDALLDSVGKPISLAVWSSDGQKVILYNTEQTYFSACTIKVPWMLCLCKGIDSGKYNKDTVLTYEQRHFHEGSGNIRKGNFGDTYTVEQLLKLCLSISDNVAYEMLVEYIGRSDFNAFTAQLGYQSFQLRSGSIWSSNSVVKDYVGIWNEVYKYIQEGTVGAGLFKKGCTNTPFGYGVKTLTGADYSHKSGDNFPPNAVYNDAGIVWAQTPYIYAMFSKSDESAAEIAAINKAMSIVHEAFGGNPAH